MKSLLKIIRRYIATAAIITMVVFIINISLILGIVYQASKKEYRENYQNSSRSVMNSIGKELHEKDGGYELTSHGYQLLEKSEYVWAMLIDENGNVAWSWKLPDNIPQSYTMADVSVLSKWYVQDYPVRTWIYGDGLMVYAHDINTVSKINGEYSVKFIGDLPQNMLIWIVANLSLIIILALYLGYRFYRSLKPVAYGIEGISQQEKISLPEKGITEELARKLNKTSEILEEKNAKLTQRDNARTEWIAGVSHDIRTPLALIMGYASGLSEDEHLNTEQREKAAAIQRQSLNIKKLIEDLNLTSKLEYNVQPLRMENYSPARLMRDIVAEYYNDGLDDKYTIYLVIQQQVEEVMSLGDVELLKRCFRNIIGNSIRHNKEGCFINICLNRVGISVEYIFQDSGGGIGDDVVHLLENNKEETPSGHIPHVMGLRVVQQIVQAHQGTLEFTRRASGGSDIKIIL